MKIMKAEFNDNITPSFLIKMFTLYLVIILGVANKSKFIESISNDDIKNVASIQSNKGAFSKN